MELDMEILQSADLELDRWGCWPVTQEGPVSARRKPGAQGWEIFGWEEFSPLRRKAF